MEIKEGYYIRNNGSLALIQVIGEHESGDLLCLWAFDNDGKPFRYHPFEFKNEFEAVSEEYVNNIERHRCPDNRSVHSVFRYSQNGNNPNPDRWDVRDGVRKCSYCGSVHPDDLIGLIREHGFKIIEPTTKSYKWYINAPNLEYSKYYRSHDENSDFINKYNQLVDELKTER